MTVFLKTAAALASLGIALSEYVFQVPANRIGNAALTAIFASAVRPSGELFSQARVGAVQGTVVDSAGGPLEGVDIVVGVRTTRSNARGAFLVDSLATGGHTLVARFPGHTAARVPVTVSAGRPVELLVRLLPSAYYLPEVIVESRRTGIFGVVTGPALAPLPGARVQISGAGGKDTRTDSAGAYAFPEIRPGEYLVRVTAPGYGEQRSMVEVKRGEGRQVRFRLVSARSSPSRADDVAVADLGLRLVAGRRSDRLTSTQLERYATLGLCDLGQIREQLGPSNGFTTLILNGTTVIQGFLVASVCAWQANEVDLVEFGNDYCEDRTQTIPALVSTGARCMPGRSSRSRTRSYIVLWEKR